MYTQSTVQKPPQRDWLLSERPRPQAPVRAFIRHVPDARQIAIRERAAQQRLDRLMDGHEDIRQIVVEVCAAHDIHAREIIGHRRQKKYTRPRHEVWWRVWNETDLTLSDIAGRFGRSDHTTIKHGIDAHERRIRGAT